MLWQCRVAMAIRVQFPPGPIFISHLFACFYVFAILNTCPVLSSDYPFLCIYYITSHLLPQHLLQIR